MDWIHCNSCSKQPGQDKSQKFQLTSCGHIFCSQCVEASTNPVCKVCSTKCNSLQLSSQMPPDIQHYFSDPDEMIRKALAVIGFQKGHRQRLSSSRANRSSIEHQLAEENKKLRIKMLEQAKYIAKLENKLIQFKQMTSGFQTPMKGQGKSVNFNSPMMMTPTLHSPAPSSIGSQLKARSMSQTERKVSPHFLGSSEMYNRVASMNRVSPLGKVMNSSESNSRQKCSPRESFRT